MKKGLSREDLVHAFGEEAVQEAEQYDVVPGPATDTRTAAELWAALKEREDDNRLEWLVNAELAYEGYGPVLEALEKAREQAQHTCAPTGVCQLCATRSVLDEALAEQRKRLKEAHDA